jgi:dihydrofolate synthase/folylpolyglutamate synthase
MKSISTIERKAEERLLELRRFGIKLGLAQTKELFSRLGNPQHDLKFAHVAGTNGKGSVCAMLSAGLTNCGFTTGFYSSPHLVAVRERFRINGRAISPEQFADLVDRIMPIINEMRENGSFITYFEATTALAALAFREANARFAVWETGMGGRFDATNIVDPEICVITTIAVEHANHLGKTIAEIAFEKAGIIKPGIPVFCGEMSDEAKEVIEKRAMEVNAPCFFLPHSYTQTNKANCDFRETNATLAKMAITHLSAKFAFSPATAIEGMSKVKWPGRHHELNDGTIVDGAHNPNAIEALVTLLTSQKPDRRWSIIFAALDDKDVEPILRKLLPIANEFIFPKINSTDRATPPAKLAKTLGALSSVPAKLAPNVATSLLMTETVSDRLIVGSLYLAGETLAELLPINEITDIHQGIP